MAENYVKNHKKSKYLEGKLREIKKYQQIFEKYGIDENTDVQICNFAEFLEVEKHRNSEKPLVLNATQKAELEKVYMLIQEEENRAIMVNTNRNGKMPTGELAVYDLENQKIALTNEQLQKAFQEKLQINLDKYAKNVFDTSSKEKEQKMLESSYPKTLEEMEMLVLRWKSRD